MPHIWLGRLFDRELELRRARLAMRCGLLGLLALALGQTPRVGAAAPTAPTAPEDKQAAQRLCFANHTLEGWSATGTAWRISPDPKLYVAKGERTPVATSYEAGEASTGTLTSPVFTITSAVQSFRIAGWDGAAGGGQNQQQRNFVILRASPDGTELFRAHTPGQDKLLRVYWDSAHLLGHQVYLEIVDGNAANPARGELLGAFAWLAFADYRQGAPLAMQHPEPRTDLYALPLHPQSNMTYCRTLPFLASPTSATQVAIGAPVRALYLLGLINDGWDKGVAHWGEHPELAATRDDQVYIGATIGTLVIHYADGSADRVPLTIGATAWYGEYWLTCREPFASRPDCRAVLDRVLRLHRAEQADAPLREQFYLALKPRPLAIASLEVLDNPAFRGRPLVAAVTLASETTPTATARWLGQATCEADDLQPRIDTAAPGDWTADLTALKDVLYTKEADLPAQPALLDYPRGFDAARLRFTGGRFGAMLSNVWVANMVQMAGKFESETGFFNESSNTTPNYASYSGFGTWSDSGGYYGMGYARSAEHYATCVMRAVNDPRRWMRMLDYTDKWLYYYRPNHDPAQGPPNPGLDISRYPADAPPHWGMEVNGSFTIPLNEIAGNEEMDGHGAVLTARWLAWRLAGKPTGGWMTDPRADVYGKSRWRATQDATEFICWLMAHSGRDVIFSEGEGTGWGGGGALSPAGWYDETDPAKIRHNYQVAEMYETYPATACMTALRCSAEMADAMGEPALAERWRAHADRIERAMLKELTLGTAPEDTWRFCRMSVFPTQQDCMAPGWFSIYRTGYDPQRWQPDILRITRNTLHRQLAQKPGTAPVLAMGYGQGWLTQTALLLDEMDTAGEALCNIARYSYDKNLDYADPARGLDWRQWLWLIPEGTNILPDGRWHRIGDLTNGANQGPAMHALETCAGIDDTSTHVLRILPRLPDPLTELEVKEALALLPAEQGALQVARVSYSYRRGGAFTLYSSLPLPALEVRLGPFADENAARTAQVQGHYPAGATTRREASGTYKGQPAWWLWVEGLKNVREVKLAQE